MTLRLWNTSILTIGMAGGALSALGCGQGAISEPAEDAIGASVDEALSAVRDCQTQARECAADATSMACDDALRACLSAATAMKGGQGKDDAEVQHVMGDAGPKPHVEGDAGPKPHVEDDAEPPHTRDPVVHADAAAPEPPKPVREGGASPVATCIDELHVCLDTSAAPRTCAQAAVTCLSAVRDARKP